MAKKMSKREYLLIVRAHKRAQSLKVNPVAKGVKISLAEKNREVISRLEAKLAKA